MKKRLTAITLALYHYVGETRVYGDCSGISGNCSRLYGNCSGIYGDCSGIYGDCSGISGDCSRLSGNCSRLSGNCSGIYGDCSGIYGNIDECEISDAERETGILIRNLIDIAACTEEVLHDDDRVEAVEKEEGK